MRNSNSSSSSDTSDYESQNHLLPKYFDLGESYEKPSDETLMMYLSDLQYKVTQEEATEPAFNNQYWDEWRDGIYVDVVSGEPLFSSKDKYKSGTGWPSFVDVLNEEFIVEKTDYLLLYPRTEIRSTYADSHIGHVFNDGPQDRGGLRYCMNSAALEFIPVEEMEERGYGEYLYFFEN